MGGTTTLGVQGMDANGQEVAAPQLDMRLGFDLTSGEPKACYEYQILHFFSLLCPPHKVKESLKNLPISA